MFASCSCPVDKYEVCGVSLNRPAYQRSVYISADGFKHKASLANDGYRNPTTCAMTNTGTNPWWIVNFGTSLTVINVTLTSGVNYLSTGNQLITFHYLNFLQWRMRCLNPQLSSKLAKGKN